MENIFRILSSQDFKKAYLPFLDTTLSSNSNSLQLYTIEQYLRGILTAQHPYRTSFNFIIFVTNGVVEQQINKTTYKISQYESVHIRQGAWTVTQNVSNDAEGFVIVYESDVLTQYFLMEGRQDEFKYTPYYSLNLFDYQAIIASVILLNGELLHTENRPNIYMPIFYSILSRLNSYSKEAQHNIRDFEIVYLFKKLVNEHHITHRSVGFYAQKLCISENYLNRCVKQVTGKSAKHWIGEINIQYSLVLLRDLTKDIAQIAYELNYPTPTYFSKVFKKTIGLSPIQYRNSLQTINLAENTIG